MKSLGHSSQERQQDEQSDRSEGTNLANVQVLNPSDALCVKDMRGFRLNEKSDDNGSSVQVTPKDLAFMTDPSLVSKVNSPDENSASYLDKSNTKHIYDLQQTPSLSNPSQSVHGTGVDQFEQRKASQDSVPAKVPPEPKREKLDTDSSRSKESAPDAPQITDHDSVPGSLARVTSYHKLQENVE